MTDSVCSAMHQRLGQGCFPPAAGAFLGMQGWAHAAGWGYPHQDVAASSLVHEPQELLLQVESARYGHMEDRMMALPPMIPFLERVAALALPVVPALDAMPLANILWALGTLRHSPAGVSCLLPVQSERPPGEHRSAGSECHTIPVIESPSDIAWLPSRAVQ